MNTKKVIFGLLAMLMLAAASVSAYAVDGQDTGVDKRKITKPKNNS